MNIIQQNRYQLMAKLAAATILGSLSWSVPAIAEENLGNRQQQSVERIIGSEVREKQARSEDDTDRIIAAIEKSSENTNRIRKVTNLDRLDIIFMPDSTAVEGGPPEEVASRLSEYSRNVDDMRRELESNALFYHAVNSRNILIKDILAIEFDSDTHVVIFAAANPPR